MSAFPETSRIHQNIILTFHFTQEHAGAFYEEDQMKTDFARFSFTALKAP